MIEAQEELAGRSRPVAATSVDREASLFVGRSMTGSLWTLVSRVTGLVRIVVMGAVLGATYLGNAYQGLNAIPNLIYYQILAGSLFVSLLVPPLVRHIRDDDPGGAEVLVRGFFGGVLGLALAAMALVMVTAPLILELFSAGISNASVAEQQRSAGLILLLLFAPQIPLYVFAGTGAGVMNAYGRFALAAGAPTAENLGIIVTLLVTAVVFGTDTTLDAIPSRELLLLGLGTTAAVALHAGLEWFGARRSMPGMRPGLGWNHPEVRIVLSRIRAVLGFTGLAAVQLFASLVVANRVGGGLVAFQLALNFFYLPIAIVTWPIARALVPRLAALHQEGRLAAYRDELSRAVALACFVAVPIALAYACSAFQIADIVAFGRLDSDLATDNIALALIALSPAVIGETWFTLGSYALYARQDVRSPVASMAVRVGVSLLLMVPACLAHGSTVLLLLGAALSISSFAGAAHVWRRAIRVCPDGSYPLAGSLGRTAVASLTTAAPATFTWLVLAPVGGSRAADAVRLGLALAVAAGAYLAIQARLHAPEIGLLRGGARGLVVAVRGGDR